MYSSRSYPLRSFGWLLAAVQLVARSGCGGQGERPPLGRVSGAVTLGGRPLTDAEVTFAPESGRPSAGRTDSSGSSELSSVMRTKGAKVGKHRVFIEVIFCDHGRCD